MRILILCVILAAIPFAWGQTVAADPADPTEVQVWIQQYLKIANALDSLNDVNGLIREVLLGSINNYTRTQASNASAVALPLPCTMSPWLFLDSVSIVTMNRTDLEFQALSATQQLFDCLVPYLIPLHGFERTLGCIETYLIGASVPITAFIPDRLGYYSAKILSLLGQPVTTVDHSSAVQTIQDAAHVMMLAQVGYNLRLTSIETRIFGMDNTTEYLPWPPVSCFVVTTSDGLGITSIEVGFGNGGCRNDGQDWVRHTLPHNVLDPILYQYLVAAQIELNLNASASAAATGLTPAVRANNAGYLDYVVGTCDGSSQTYVPGQSFTIESLGCSLQSQTNINKADRDPNVMTVKTTTEICLANTPTGSANFSVCVGDSCAYAAPKGRNVCGRVEAVRFDNAFTAVLTPISSISWGALTYRKFVRHMI